MQTLIKIVLIVFALLLGTVLLALIQEGRGTGHYGPLGVVVAFAVMAGVKAIWSYRSENPPQEEPSDSDKLNKS